MKLNKLLKELSQYDGNAVFGVLAHVTDQDQNLQFYDAMSIEKLYFNAEFSELSLTEENLYLTAYNSLYTAEKTLSEKDDFAKKAVANAIPVVSVYIDNCY